MNQYCPNCKRSFSEAFDECPYCEGALIEQALEETIIPTDQYIKQQKKPGFLSLGKIWGFVGACILVIFLMVQGFAWLNSDDKNESHICSSCHKKFTNSTDVKSISWTSMCEPCYENYKFKQKLQEELKKYLEHN